MISWRSLLRIIDYVQLKFWEEKSGKKNWGSFPLKQKILKQGTMGTKPFNRKFQDIQKEGQMAQKFLERNFEIPCKVILFWGNWTMLEYPIWVFLKWNIQYLENKKSFLNFFIHIIYSFSLMSSFLFGTMTVNMETFGYL